MVEKRMRGILDRKQPQSPSREDWARVNALDSRL